MSEKPSLSEIMKAVANMQSSMKATQENLENSHLTGIAGVESGNNDISITINGRFSCLGCEISENFMQQEKAVMEQLVINALNDAVEKVGSITRKQIETLSADLKDNK